MIMMDVQMEEILGRFSEDRTKLFLGCVHEAHGNCENGGRGKTMRSAKNEGKPNYRGMSQDWGYLEVDWFWSC